MSSELYSTDDFSQDRLPEILEKIAEKIISRIPDSESIEGGQEMVNIAFGYIKMAKALRANSNMQINQGK